VYCYSATADQFATPVKLLVANSMPHLDYHINIKCYRIFNVYITKISIWEFCLILCISCKFWGIDLWKEVSMFKFPLGNCIYPSHRECLICACLSDKACGFSQLEHDLSGNFITVIHNVDHNIHAHVHTWYRSYMNICPMYTYIPDIDHTWTSVPSCTQEW